MRLPMPLIALIGSALLGVTACAGGDQERAGAGGDDVRLGPMEGRELPPAELERVSVGDAAPDFRLESLRRGVVALSDYRGEKDVVLVFYRGHW
jgi:hypothetical protein